MCNNFNDMNLYLLFCDQYKKPRYNKLYNINARSLNVSKFEYIDF